MPAAVPTAPYPPSFVESRCYYYGLPSRPILVARSSPDVWLEPTGPEAYNLPKETHTIGLHPLREIWEATVGPAMVDYLDSMEIKWTSLDPVRMGYATDSSPPVIVWMGVVPGSLSAEEGIKVATHCKSILSAHDIDDVHVEIRESVVVRSAGPQLYKPASMYDSTARVREPFSTALGLPICAEVTPSIEGTGGFFISDPLNPGKIYLVTARHILFPPGQDSNEFYQHRNNPNQPRRNVLLFGNAAIEKYITAIESEVRGKYFMNDWFERRLERTKQMDEEHAKKERKHVLRELEETTEAISAISEFYTNVSKDWRKREDRILGHVVLSPPISFSVGEEGFTEDWAVIEVDDSKLNLTNFVGNVIDLGITIPIYDFITWMSPHPTNPPSFDYPHDRLLKLSGTISDEEIWKPSLKALDHDNDPCIMVIKCGNTTGLTIGRLNTIRSFTKVYFNDQPDHMSKEVVVLPRNYESNAFSEPGDSGSAVVDGKGRLAGLLTGGAGDTEAFDCTYVTSANFILKRMLEYGLEANLYPSLG